MPANEYQIIYADPPWQYGDKMLPRGGAERHYQTLPTWEISKFNVRSLAAPNSVLFCWATFPLIEDALFVMRMWGFTYKTLGFVWVKTNKDGTIFRGNGHYTRSNAEVCLIGLKGRAPERLNKGMHNTWLLPREEHSKKPDLFREKIVELYGDLPRIELFARNSTPGWHVWGNEVQPDIQLDEVPIPV